MRPHPLGRMALTALAIAAVPLAGTLSGIAAQQNEPEPTVAQSGPEREQHIMDAIENMERGRGRGDIGVPREDGELLRRLAEDIRARNVVEIGTFRGYSGLWLGLALRRTGGRLTTFEIDPANAGRAQETFRKAGIDDIVTIRVGDAHVEVTRLTEPIDLLFIDADKAGYLDYLEKLLPLVRVDGLIVAHNMRVPQPDQRYVEAITLNPDLETKFVNMTGPGVAVTRKKR